MRKLILGVVASIAVLGAGAGNAAIVGHKAIYKLTLARSTPAGSIQGMSGEMTLEVSDLCDGLAINQFLLTDFWEQDGILRKGRLTSSSWESQDGQVMRFALSNKIDGELVEAFEGEARREEEGGVIVYKDSDFPEAALPADAIFPRQHLEKMLAAARSGKRTLEAVVFDGADNGKIYKTTAIIGPERKQSIIDLSRPELDGVTRWPVVLSYFPQEGDDPLPEYETSFELYENGVSTELMLDYGDFALKGRLETLEVAAPEDCK